MTSNPDTVINFIMMIIAIVSMSMTFYALHQSKKQYEQEQKPLLSAILLIRGDFIKIMIINNGKDVANKITLTDFKIEGNGNQDNIHNEFESLVFDLYPEERVCRSIAVYAPSLSLESNPVVHFIIHYLHNETQIIQERTIALCLD